ncbi:hypothetical protein EGR_06533 [Echinococcus granulosus]|uniref:Uncharacterized protein n=1 Tax=Echinococcus granulosus TaxID=6210 RepID=W6UBY8_ECHGR|nr:hypothetical protein EGR_06533 [Echinococcus granulosus]EUB58650.1 hypothetical protein EGR_06533 [Echinococcus granulosus]
MVFNTHSLRAANTVKHKVNLSYPIGGSSTFRPVYSMGKVYGSFKMPNDAPRNFKPCALQYSLLNESFWNQWILCHIFITTK